MGRGSICLQDYCRKIQELITGLLILGLQQSSSNSVNFLGEPNLFNTGIIEDWQAAYNPYYGRFDCFYAIKYSSSSDASFFGNFVIQEALPLFKSQFQFLVTAIGIIMPNSEVVLLKRQRVYLGYYNEASQNTYAASTYLGVLGNSG